MIMMGLEFTGDVPFDDVYVHSVILAPDGRRMSKSLGTGIDPLEAINEYGADALRFGLMAMSSSQDVRYSTKRVEQGRDLANKMWNASRLVLMNVDPVPPAPQAATVEDRWILSRLQRTVGRVHRKDRGIRLRPRGARPLWVLLERVLRLVSRDGEAAAIRKSAGRQAGRRVCGGTG